MSESRRLSDLEDLLNRERRRARDLDRASTASARLVEVVVQEVRTASNAIAGYASLLRQPLATESRHHAIDAIDRNSRVIAMWLALDPERPLAPVPVDLVAFAREATEYRGLSYTAGQGRVAADPDRLRTALEGLLDEARERSFATTVSVLLEDDFVRLLLIDDVGDGPEDPRVRLARLVAEVHGGSLRVTSSGAGRTIVVAFPSFERKSVPAPRDPG